MRGDTLSLQQEGSRETSIGGETLIQPPWERGILGLPDKEKPKQSEPLFTLNIMGRDRGEVWKRHWERPVEWGSGLRCRSTGCPKGETPDTTCPVWAPLVINT